MKKYNIILACDSNYGIGKNNKLPWSFSVDMLSFKKYTTSHSILPNINYEPNILIMGRKTFESMGSKSLPNRLSFVITRNKDLLKNNSENVLYFNNFYSAYIKSLEYKLSDVWVIGGSEIYNMALRFWACDKIWLTLINDTFDCDTFVPFLNNNITWINELLISDLNKNDNKTYNLTFKEGIINNNVETQYLETIYDVLISGEERQTRNAITLSKFNKTLSWDLNNGFPLLTTKKMFWKGIVEELLFFIRGDTNTNLLSEKGIKIWEPNTRRDFLDKLGLDYPEGFMGPMYGYQWRKFNDSVDQLKNIINEIKTNPNSRRLLMTDFNPCQVYKGVLYPCHSIIIQFYINDNKLSCNMYQRSGDLFLGIPFNIASTSLLVHIISKLTNLNVGTVNLIIGDYHIYKNHINSVLEQLSRVPFDLPKINLPNFNTLEQVEQSTFEDYKIINYHFHNPIKAEMIA
jgi:dihydrofolate reductase/thymidylate synthase